MKVPLISITPENENDDKDFLTLVEALTDTENLESDCIPKEKRRTKSKLKIKLTDGHATDLEDFEASDCEEDPKIVAHKKPLSIDSLDLDPGTFEETCKIKVKSAKGKRKLRTQSSTSAKNEVSLKINDNFKDDGFTDCEDIQTSDIENDYEYPEIEISPENFSDSINISEKIERTSALGFSPAETPRLISDEESTPNNNNFLTAGLTKLNILTDTEIVYSDSEMEDNSVKKSKSKLRKRRSRTKKQEAVTDVEEMVVSEEEARRYQKIKKSFSAELPKTATDLIFNCAPLVKNMQKSDSEDERFTPKKCIKTKRSKNNLQVSQIENEGMTDVDQYDFDSNVEDDFEFDQSAIKDKLDEIAAYYSSIREANSLRTKGSESNSFDTIDTDCESDTSPNANDFKNDYDVKFIKPCKSPNLKVPSGGEQATTDVESIYSSDEEILRYKNMPVAIIKQTSITETDDEELSDHFERPTNYPDLKLPEPYRKIFIIRENGKNEPKVKVMPLDDQYLLKPTQEDSYLTDVENFFWK